MTIQEKIRQKEREIDIAQKELQKLKLEEHLSKIPFEEMIGECYMQDFATQTVLVKILEVTAQETVKCLYVTYGCYYNNTKMHFVKFDHVIIEVCRLYEDYKKISSDTFDLLMDKAKDYIDKNLK